MLAIEMETTIDTAGNLHLPEKSMDPMKFSNTLDWLVDGLDYQHQARGEMGTVDALRLSTLPMPCRVDKRSASTERLETKDKA